MGVLFKEIGELYAGFLPGCKQAPRRSASLQFRDFIRWQEAAAREVTEMAAQEAYWAGEVRGRSPKPLTSPADRPSPCAKKPTRAIARRCASTPI